MRYNIGNKIYNGDITVGELCNDLEKNKECIMILDMNKGKIKDDDNLESAQSLIDSLENRRIVYK